MSESLVWIKIKLERFLLHPQQCPAMRGQFRDEIFLPAQVPANPQITDGRRSAKSQFTPGKVNPHRFVSAVEKTNGHGFV